MKICVYGAASCELDKSYIEAGVALGKEMGKRGHSLVFGGGATGLMGAVARGIETENAEIIGVAPSFFNVDGILFENCSEMILTETMRERKQIMEDKSDAFIVTVGGIGTFEEFFEILTLRSLDRHKKPIAILNTNGYYDHLVQFLQNGVNENFLKKENLDLFFVSDNEKEILSYIENFSDDEDKITKTRFV